MPNSLTNEIIKTTTLKMVDKACSHVADKGLNGQKLTDAEKEGAKGLVCESVTFVATIIAEKNITPIETGVHLVTNGTNMGKLTSSQQVYCKALMAEMVLHGGIIGAQVGATYTAAVAGGHAGVVAGGLTGTVVAGPAGTAVGAGLGVAVGAGVPLALGAWEIVERAAALTDAAINYHSQCGPLSMDKAPPQPRTAPLH